METSPSGCIYITEKKFVPFFFSVGVIVAGTGVGTCIGSYHGYQDSKKYTYTECIFTTVCFGWLGGGVGYLSTQFFPAAFVIVIVATIARQMDPAIEPEKKV